MKVFRYIAFLLIIYGTPLCGAMAELWRAAEAGNRDPVAVELLRKVNEWKYKNGVEIIREVLPGEIVVTPEEASSVLKYSGNVLCARVFVLNDRVLETYNVPFIFVSGERASKNINNKIRPFIRNITDYRFTSSSSEAFSHSERAFALSLLKEDWYSKLFSQYQSIRSCIIQIHNITNPMCNMCKNFFLCRSPYFININGIGYFVAQSYVESYRTALTRWSAFLDISIAFSVTLRSLYNSFLRMCGGLDSQDNRRAFHEVVVPQSFLDMSKKYSPFIIGTYSNAAINDAAMYAEMLTFDLR